MQSSSKYYSTKFQAPKKETPKERKLSANIQKFLQKQHIEEEQKRTADKQKLDGLMAMRDTKSKNKIKKMLKVTKSANKSVLDDAVDDDNTAYTLQGPEQPDEDDYGYVSQEAGQFYRQLMDKYKTSPDDEQRATPSRPQSKHDLSGTKDRVRAAINREHEEANQPRSRSSATASASHQQHHRGTHSSSSTANSGTIRKPRPNLYDPAEEKRAEEQRKRDERNARHRAKPPPPVFNFAAILKLAEQKQHEPVRATLDLPLPEKKRTEPERLLTSKEKRELEERQRYEAEREKRRHGARDGLPPVTAAAIGRIPKVAGATGADEPAVQRKSMEPNGRIPKLNGQSTGNNSAGHNSTSKLSSGHASKVAPPSSASHDSRKSHISGSSTTKPTHAIGSTSSASKTPTTKPASSIPSKSSSTSSSRPSTAASTSAHKAAHKSDAPRKPNMPHSAATPSSSSSVRPAANGKPSQPAATNRSANNHSTNKPSTNSINTAASAAGARKRPAPEPVPQKTRQFPPADVRTRQFPPADVRTRQFPPADVRSRQFPPADVRGGRPAAGASGNRPGADARRGGGGHQSHGKPPAAKRPRVIDDDESEYDSEMDDFIDDDDEEEDYSKHIKDIFGYDKSRYRHLDDDCDNMESSFAQQQREEFISKKIGLMEDLEDMRQEAEEKKAKARASGKRGGRRKLDDSDESD